MKTIILIAIFTICYVVCMDLVNKYMSNIDFEKQLEQIAMSEANVFNVCIEGSVVNEGEYTVVKDSTLGYLISLAGGLKDDADVSAFNSSAKLVNGGKYYIPYKRVDENNASIKISINTANQAALDTLPGIGEVFSKRIIDYRSINGKFKTIEDLKNVKGIGESLFETLKDLICL